MELGLWHPQIPPPALLRACREPSTAHSTPSIPSSVAGDDLSIFFGGTKQDPSLQTLAGGQGQGWVLFPKKQPLPWFDPAAAGVAQGALFPSLAPQVPT